MRSEASTATGERREACVAWADHWKKHTEFHRKFEPWPFWKSTLLIPLWIIREHRWMKELRELSDECVELGKKYAPATN